MILALLFGSLAIITWRLKSFFNPVNITLSWWYLWFGLSTLSLNGVNSPSRKSTFIIFIFLVSIAVGALLAQRPENKFHKTDLFYSRFKASFPYICYGLTPFLFPAFVRSLYLFSQKGIHHYKAYAFSTPEAPGLLFLSSTLESIYFIWTGPLLLLLTLFGFTALFKFNEKRYLLIAIVANSMDAILRLGRSNVYIIILITLSSLPVFSRYWLQQSRGLSNKRKRIISVLSFIFISSSIVLSIGFARKERNIESLKEQFNVYVVNYHTLGFALFDNEAKFRCSRLNRQLTYGRLTFGGLESLATIFIRRFDRDYTSPAHENLTYMNKNFVVGYHPTTKKPIKYNAFFTILYTLYSDARILGIVFGGILFGWLLTYHFVNWQAHHDSHSAAWIMFLMFIGLTSIFNSPMENMRTWLVIIGLISINKVSYFSRFQWKRKFHE